MFVYAKKVDGAIHLFGSTTNAPTVNDTQLTYTDEEGNVVTDLTLSESFLDDGQGGIIRQADGEKILVFIGDANIIPGNSEVTPVEPELPAENQPEE